MLQILGVEANLDIQYMMGIAPSVPTTYWSIAANSTLEIGKIHALFYMSASTL